jgi:glycosyltransferase involved in cell wall biosynthesis
MDDPGSRLLVVVPSYNERENVDALIDGLERARVERPFDVLFVDDGSPDGTGAAIAALASPRPWIHLLERSAPLGLGSAYRAGFRWGRDRGFGRLGEMDADLSHDPAVIPALDAAVPSRADLAVGSRYVKGGACVGWPFARRALSAGANAFARLLLRLPQHDVTAGFRVYSARAIDLLLEEGTECDGYGFQVETLYLVHRRGLRICEIPITFRERAYGRSKMSKRTIWEAARRCVSLALAPPRMSLSLPIAEVSDGHA